jgi:dGTPase
MSAKAARVIRDLFDAFFTDPRLLPFEAQRKVRQLEHDGGDNGRARAVADYIAGMTDRYAIKEHERIYNPGELT